MATPGFRSDTRLPPVVCLSSQAWHDGMWTNKQHVMSRLAERTDVYHVEFGPLPARALRERKRHAGRTADSIWAPHVETADGVTLLHLWSPAAGLGGLRAGHPLRRFAEFDLRRALLARFLRREGLAAPILWVYHPGYGARVARIPHRLLVYDCVDDFAEFPAYRGDPAWLRARESTLARRADLVFATSPALHEARRRDRPEETHLVPNVADAAHFERAQAPDLPTPRELDALPRPILGFVGAVSEYKLAVPWLLELARRRPDASIVLVGPVGHGEAHGGLAPLEPVPNLHLLGHRPYARLPEYLKAFDVCLLPYRRSAYTESCFPIKFFEYLASGKPVVSAALPALEEHFGAVHVARSADEFVTGCEAALADPWKGRFERIALARRHTWEHRVETLWSHVERKLAEPARP